MREGTSGEESLAFFQWVTRTYGIGKVTAERKDVHDFHANFQAVSFDAVNVSLVDAGPLVLERSVRDVSGSDPDILSVGFLLEGRSVQSQGGREAVLDRSDIVLIDSREPFRVRYDTPFRKLLVDFSRRQLTSRVPNIESLTATRIDGARGLGAVTSALVHALHAESPSMGAAAGVVTEYALDLIALTFGRSMSEAGIRRTFAARVRAYIEANLRDPALSADGIARQYGISRRYLYRMFEADSDSVMGFIRRRRLERCRAELGEPRSSERTVAEIAFAWGFNDASHFSRAFTSAFGLSPRAYRRAQRP